MSPWSSNEQAGAGDGRDRQDRVANRLKTALARRPLVGFFALGGAAWAVYVCVAIARPHDWDWTRDWSAYASPLSHVALGLVALVCCWAVSGRPDKRPRRLTQLFIVVAVTVLAMGVTILRTWITWRWLRAVGAAEASSSATHTFIVGSVPSLASMIHSDLRNVLTWLTALTVGLVIGGVVSPYAVVRRNARSLVEVRSARVWGAVGLALLAVAACVVVTRIGAAFVRANGSSDIPVTLVHPISYIAVGFVWRLLLVTTTAYAWYGFVARRLEGRLSPLVVGLLIGLGLALPSLLAFWIDNTVLGEGLIWIWSRSVAISVGGDLALAVIGVWLARCARGSLLPTLLLFAAFPAGAEIAARTSSTTRESWAIQHYSIAIVVAAVAFVVVGRMWRRPEAAAAPTSGTPTPDPGSYEVVVHDVSMPL